MDRTDPSSIYKKVLHTSKFHVSFNTQIDGLKILLYDVEN